MKICISCGKEIRDDATKCKFCGETFHEDKPVETEREVTAKKGGSKRIGIILGIVFIALTIVWYLWLSGTFRMQKNPHVAKQPDTTERLWRGKSLSALESYMGRTLREEGHSTYFRVWEDREGLRSEVVIDCRIKKSPISEREWREIEIRVAEFTGLVSTEVDWEISKLRFLQGGLERRWIAGIECTNAAKIEEEKDRREYILSNIMTEKPPITTSFEISTKKRPRTQPSKSAEKTVGLSEWKRKDIFYDLVELQDNFLKKDPYNTQKQQDAYRIIAKRYGIAESEVRKIAIEGAKKRWPMPDY